MKKLIKILALSLTLICIGLPGPVLAQERGDTSPSIAVSKEAKAKLKATRTIAIFLSGNDALLSRIAEDAIAIHLTNAGFTIINREMLEKSVGEQVAKMKKEKVEGAINVLEIGLVVNADSILTGTIVIESGEQSSLLVQVASFQLVDIGSGKTLINVLLESEKGNSLSETAKRFADILRQNRE